MNYFLYIFLSFSTIDVLKHFKQTLCNKTIMALKSYLTQKVDECLLFCLL